MIDWKKEKEELYFEKGEGPFYTDYLYSVQKDYPGLGLARCNWVDGEGNTDIPYLYAHKGQLVEYFNLNYALREIGAETESRWQLLVNKVFETVKRKYNYYFHLYESNEVETLGRILEESYSLTRDSTANGRAQNNSTGNVTSNSKSKYQDMPIQQFIEAGNYATNITDGDSTENTTSGSESISGNEVHTTDELNRFKNENDESILEQVNKNTDIWRDLIVLFVGEFKNCFINELARI